jgi:hypothetical protein
MSRKQAGGHAARSEPMRWLSRAGAGDAPEDRLAALMRAGEPPGELGAAGRARVWARLRRGSRTTRSLASLRWSVAAVVLLTSGVVIGAMSARRWWAPAPVAAKPEPRAAEPRAARAARHVGEPSAPALDEPAAPPEASPPPVAVAPSPAATTAAPPATAFPSAAPILATEPARPRPQARPSRAVALATAPPEATSPPSSPALAPSQEPPSPAPAESAPPAPSSLAGETPLLSEALTRLRQQRDARGALASLDAYDAHYPHGMLRREAEGARIDALLMLGRDDDAVAVLRALELQPQGRDQELRVIRGELTAPTDCARAIVDFSRVLAETPTDALAERALHGRAACHVRLGDKADAARDLAEYLRRFPAGRFAAEARRATQEP